MGFLDLPSLVPQCYVCGWGEYRPGSRPLWIVCYGCLAGAERIGVREELMALAGLLRDEQRKIYGWE